MATGGNQKFRSGVQYLTEISGIPDPIDVDKSNVLYVPNELLLQYLKDENSVKKYLGDCGAIIVDEFQEREIGTDILVGILRKRMDWIKHIKIIFTVSSSDPAILQEYFQGCPAIEIQRPALPVEVIYKPSRVFLGSTPAEISQRVFAQCIDILSSTKMYSGNILCFLPGNDEVGSSLFFSPKKF